MEGVFQTKARQSSQHSSCRTGANFYRHLTGKNTITIQRKQRSESAEVGTVLFLLLKNCNRESEVVLAWMWQLGGLELLGWAREQPTSHRAKDIMVFFGKQKC